MQCHRHIWRHASTCTSKTEGLRQKFSFAFSVLNDMAYGQFKQRNAFLGKAEKSMKNESEGVRLLEEAEQDDLRQDKMKN